MVVTMMKTMMSCRGHTDDSDGADFIRGADFTHLGGGKSELERILLFLETIQDIFKQNVVLHTQ